MDIKARILRYCQYQDRCQKEVRNKLYELGARTPEVQELIAELITEQWLNEERFARSFARGKFRIKNWGKQKIVYELKLLQISPYCIKKGLEEIDPEEYDACIRNLAKKKLAEIKDQSNKFITQSKIQRYLMQKGYESDLTREAIQSLFS